MTTKSQNATEQSEGIAETPRAAVSKQRGKIQGNCSCGSGKLSGGRRKWEGKGGEIKPAGAPSQNILRAEEGNQMTPREGSGVMQGSQNRVDFSCLLMEEDKRGEKGN